MDVSRADPGYGLRVESSREVGLGEGDAGDPRGVTLSAVEVEISWMEGSRGVREVVDLFGFKELYREASRRGLSVVLAPGYTHQREAAPQEEGQAPAGESAEKFDLLDLVRDLLRWERESLGPAYG